MRSKIVLVLLCLMIGAMLPACGNNGDAARVATNQPAGVNDVLQAGIDEAEADIDLTALSSTMVYSEVYNMTVTPDEYIGKTVKMDGEFTALYDESADKYYYACIIQDATACCAQGIEFELTDEYSYPDDYPEEGDNVSVVGVFDTYQEGEYTYCTLREAKLE